MAETAFTADDFQPAAATESAQAVSRPSLSYWQDAWIRLKANRRALFSLYLVVGLALFTLVGPLIWTVDPSLQDLEQISQPPGANRDAVVVMPHRPWDGTVRLPEVRGLELAEPATTQSVRLAWAPLPNAAGYRLYRNLFPAAEGQALGLPLFETFSIEEPSAGEREGATPRKKEPSAGEREGATPRKKEPSAGEREGLAPRKNQRHFEDRLDLKPRTYYYSVAALDAQGQMTGAVHSLELAVARVITAQEAEAMGLVADAGQLQPGDRIKLRAHPLGTDYLGRDLLARLMAGAQVSLFIGIAAPLLFIAFGVIYGAAAGFLGGWADQALMRFSDFVVALPFLLFMILLRVASGVQPGESGITPMVLAMVLLSWPAAARLVRGQILQIREEGYISASRLLGGGAPYLVLRHMIPNTLGVILVTMTFAVPTAIFTEAFLSFIGMGVAPPTPSWGSMCNEGIKTMLTTPHELIFPALFISVTVLAFNLLGDGLRDALDARMRSAE